MVSERVDMVQSTGQRAVELNVQRHRRRPGRTWCQLRRDPPDSDPSVRSFTGVNHVAILLTLIPMLTVFGNSLVVVSVIREKTLRTVTNYFIVSLATSDVMVALLVMPLSIYSEV